MIPLLANWKLVAGALLGALLCWPVASCQGERRADKANAEKIIAASEKVKLAAAKAELVATAADAIRRGESAVVVQELKGIVDDKGTDAASGPAVTGVLDRLRRDAR